MSPGFSLREPHPRSDGKQCRPKENWTNGEAFDGGIGTFFADVDGSGRAAAIAVNSTGPSAGIWVRRSDGKKFGLKENWTNGEAFDGSIGTFFADVVGTGRAAAIVVNQTVWG
ncbi:MAG: hypothetical protein V3W41_09045 [Planctomycetota bacterium]